MDDNTALVELTQGLAAGAALETAAQQWGCRTLTDAVVPCLAVARNRSRVTRSGAEILRTDLGPGELVRKDGIAVTSPLRTGADLARRRGLVAAVVFLDSALQRGLIRPAELSAAGRSARGPGAAKVRAAFDAADGRSQSAPESVLRVWLTSDQRVGRVVPQMRLRPDGHPYDAGLPDLRSVAEFQSWEWHAQRAVWVRDARWGNQAYARRFGYVQYVFEDIVLGRDHVVALALGECDGEHGSATKAASRDQPRCEGRGLQGAAASTSSGGRGSA